MAKKKTELEYIEVDCRILRRLDPRTKGLRSADWDGYQAALDKILITARPIEINDMERLSAEYKVPFFKNQAHDMVCKWNQWISNEEAASE